MMAALSAYQMGLKDFTLKKKTLLAYLCVRCSIPWFVIKKIMMIYQYTIQNYISIILLMF